MLVTPGHSGCISFNKSKHDLKQGRLFHNLNYKTVSSCFTDNK